MEKDGHEVEVEADPLPPEESCQTEIPCDDDLVEREWLCENGIVRV